MNSNSTNPKTRPTTFTPLSKALAAALFILMPFAGVYIGYTFAPEKVVENEVVTKVQVTNSATQDKIELESTNIPEELLELQNEFMTDGENVYRRGRLLEDVSLDNVRFAIHTVQTGLGAGVQYDVMFNNETEVWVPYQCMGAYKPIPTDELNNWPGNC